MCSETRRQAGGSNGDREGRKGGQEVRSKAIPRGVPQAHKEFVSCCWSREKTVEGFKQQHDKI